MARRSIKLIWKKNLERRKICLLVIVAINCTIYYDIMMSLVAVMQYQ